LGVVEGRVTRGHGLLEGFLARQRSLQADRLIPDGFRSGRVLDIGCGTYPLFLVRTRFAERYGLDRQVATGLSGLTLIAHDVATNRRLPFESQFFDVVTMLAVFEHLEPGVLLDLLREIRRVLRPGGIYVMTTPAKGTEGLLGLMSRLHLVSREEVGEHQGAYTKPEIAELLERAGFQRSAITGGSFQAGMNLWSTARAV